MYRTHHCGELNSQFVNQNVTLAGWVQTIRKFGAITFVDLRDRYSITQLLIGEELQTELDKNPLGREFVIQVKGTVIERSSKNANIPTGDIEVKVAEFKILNASAVPPFTIQDDTDGGDDLRMKYRFLDLRRPQMQKNLRLRHRAARAIRHYLDDHGFIDIETPMLYKSTPEGAREVFAEQARALAGAGVDVIWIETMSDVSEAVAAMLRARGYRIVASEDDCDVLLLNTCSVRDAAEQKAIGKAANIAHRKRRGPLRSSSSSRAAARSTRSSLVAPPLPLARRRLLDLAGPPPPPPRSRRSRAWRGG